MHAKHSIRNVSGGLCCWAQNVSYKKHSKYSIILVDEIDISLNTYTLGSMAFGYGNGDPSMRKLEMK